MKIKPSDPTLKTLPTNTDQDLPTPSGPTDLKKLSHTFFLRELLQGGRAARQRWTRRRTQDARQPEGVVSTNLVFFRSAVAGRIPIIAVGVPACWGKGRLARLLHRVCARTKRSGGVRGSAGVGLAVGGWWPPLPLPPLLQNGGEGDLLWDVVPGVALVPRLPQATF